MAQVLTDPTALPATKKLLERRQKETLLLQQVGGGGAPRRFSSHEDLGT